MPAVTYLNDIQIKHLKYVPSDAELNDLLAEVRKLTKEEWLIRSEYNEEVKSWFGKGTPAFWDYTLYFLLPNGVEAQRVNLRSSVLSHGYTKEESRALITNFLMGIINGYAACRDEEGYRQNE